MNTEKTDAISKCEAALIRKSGVAENAEVRGRFIVEWMGERIYGELVTC